MANIPIKIVTVMYVSLLYACATPQVIESVEAPVAGESIAFGSVELFQDGEKKNWGMTWEGDRFCIIPVLPPETSESVCYKVGKDGNFYWSLGSGEHILLGSQIHKGGKSSHMRTRFLLIVPDGVSAVYAGNIQIHEKDYLYTTSIIDDYDNAVKLFNSKYPFQDAKIINRLLVVEDAPGEYDYLSSQCKGSWGVKCSSTMWNVKWSIDAVYPPTKEVHFTEDDLFIQIEEQNPRFEWEPSAKTGISYDLVIYEATKCIVTGIKTSYMPGRLTAYIEDIKTPHYQLEKTLKPDTRYLWTVRLRDENSVSSWSSFNYSNFKNIIYTTAVYRSYFGFKTP